MNCSQFSIVVAKKIHQPIVSPQAMNTNCNIYMAVKKLQRATAKYLSSKLRHILKTIDLPHCNQVGKCANTLVATQIHVLHHYFGIANDDDFIYYIFVAATEIYLDK